MANRYPLLKSIFISFIAYSVVANAAPITWTAQSPNNNMDNPANWNPNTVPGSGDNAIFDSTISGIAKNPTESSSPFSVSTFNFLHSASDFSFNFNNKTLTFNGLGITGGQTNTTIDIANLNNSSFPGNLLSFLGAAGTSGSAEIISSNHATLTGNQSNTGLGAINSNVYSIGPYTIANDGKVTASNEGNDSTNGTGNNGTANTGSSQLMFNLSFTAGDNVAVSVSNSGTFSGSNTAQGDSVGVINGSQFRSAGAFQVGDNFSCEVQNSGNNSSSGIGLSNIGQTNAAQMVLETTGTVGNNCAITVSNNGTNSSQTTSFSNFVGYLNDEQFLAGSTFLAGNDFSLTVSNSGTDTSTGHGLAFVAAINSNSGTTGNQVLFQQGCAFGDRATLDVTNNGNYSGTNTSGGSTVGLMNLGQIAFGDSTAPGSYTFNAGDDFFLSASNIGNDSGQGIGGDAVGDVSVDQVAFYTPCSLGNNAKMTLTNTGNFSGQASASFVSVGNTGSSQLNCLSSFQTGDGFTLIASNSGTHTGTGSGNNFVGDLINGQQVGFKGGLVLGDNAFIGIVNGGLNSSSTTARNQVGSLMAYGKQLLVKEQFQAGDNLLMVIINSGFDDSTGAGGNYVGFINNNTLDHTASQLHLDAGGTIGDDATIILSNAGAYEGSNTSNMNLVGILAGQQLHSVADFHVGDNFVLIASNSGIDNASGQINHGIGGIDGGQAKFDNACVLGDHATVVLVNNGTNYDTTGIDNTIGYINGAQMKVGGNFTAGIDLNLIASNAGTNVGPSNNVVGVIDGLDGSQLLFGQSCTLNDGAEITAFNSGTVANSQIVFSQGFNIASGKAMIQAVNNGSVGSFGVDIQGSNAGGNAGILLSNSSLNVETTLPTFTIGGLDSNSTCFVQSRPMLILNTDATTQAEFAGVIQDFPATISTLVKTGPGIQMLSGVNTYTGLTTVQEGTLVLTGSVAGDLSIHSFGTLKGTGIIGGTVTNAGTISPGESIGTLSVLGSYNNNGGYYDAEVNGAGLSDLILVSGTANLNGGDVVVSSIDGAFLFNQPYAIVTAESVNGTYSRAYSLAFIKSILTYDPSNVYLTLLPDLSRAADTCNQLAVARQIDTLTNPNATQTVIISDIANLPRSQAQDALESFSGYQYADDTWAAEIANRQFIRRLYDPLRSIVTTGSCCWYDPCQESGLTTWLESGGGAMRFRGDKEANGFHVSSYEITGGFQRRGCCDITVGIAGSYEYDSIHYQHGGSGRRNVGFAGLYGLYRPAGFYALADVIYGQSSNRMKRSIHAGSLNDKICSKPKISQAAFYGEIGVDFEMCRFLLQPFAGIQTGKSWRNHVTEKNDSGFGLDVQKHHWESTSTRLGIHLTTTDCQCVDVSLDVAWNKLLSNRKNSIEARFIDFGSEFDIFGVPFDDNGIDYNLTISTSICDGLRAYVEFGGEAWRHAITYDALAGVEFAW